MNIIIYPSPSKKLNVNEKSFSQIYNEQCSNSLFIEDINVTSLSELIKKYNQN